jgi:hypothetical protein
VELDEIILKYPIKIAKDKGYKQKHSYIHGLNYSNLFITSIIVQDHTIPVHEMRLVMVNITDGITNEVVMGMLIMDKMEHCKV